MTVPERDVAACAYRLLPHACFMTEMQKKNAARLIGESDGMQEILSVLHFGNDGFSCVRSEKPRPYRQRCVFLSLRAEIARWGLRFPVCTRRSCRTGAAGSCYVCLSGS